MTEAKTWQGLTTKNHMGAIYRSMPQKASDYMVQLLAYHRGKSLESYLKQFPIKYFDTDDEFYWELIGSSRRNIQLVEARYQGSTVTSTDVGVGAGGSVFELVFEEDWFADGNRIVGEKNEIYPLRVLGPGRPEGTNAVYEVELMGGVTGGMPGEELVSGKRFSVDYSPVEDTMSREVGDVRFTSPISMRNEWTTLRIKHKVPGNMLDRKVFMGVPYVDRSGMKKVTNMWMHHVDYKVEETFMEEKNKAFMYSRSNRLETGQYQNIGKSGYAIREGDGIRSQMEVSNTHYYNTFNLKLIEDLLFNLSESKLGYGERMFMLRTGERGAVQFHKAVLETTSGWQTNFNLLRGDKHPAIITSTSSELHSNALSAGFQFTEFKAPNGVIVKVEVDPFYDDRERFKILHPDGGVAESYRYDILYIGSMDQPNIQMAKIRGQEEFRGYQWGFRNPFTGDMDNPNMSFDEDSAVIHKMCTQGVIVFDPSRTATLIPSILA